MESDNPWIGMLMKSISGDASVKESLTDEAIKGMVNSMLGEQAMKDGGGSAVSYAWFVWKKGYHGDTVIKWI